MVHTISLMVYRMPIRGLAVNALIHLVYRHLMLYKRVLTVRIIEILISKTIVMDWDTAPVVTMGRLMLMTPTSTCASLTLVWDGENVCVGRMTTLHCRRA